MKKEYVEIGGIKWATMNVGAEKETDFGLYFQNGEIQGYPHPTNLCKFIKIPRNFCDSVQTYWGDNWRMPTKEEFLSLINGTTIEWITDYQGSGVNGKLFTDKIDSSKTLFFPACGFCGDGSVRGIGNHGYYWSSSFCKHDAWYLFFNDSYAYMNDNYRHYGFVLRGVLADK